MFNLLFDIAQIGGGLFLAAYLYQDYRRGWVGIRALADKGPDLFDKLSLGFVTGGSEGRARKSLKQEAKKLHKAREKFAEVKAIAQGMRQKESEARQLVTEAEECARMAIEADDKVGLREAATHKLILEEHATMFGQAAEVAEQQLPVLHGHLSAIELDHQTRQLQVSKIEVNDAVTELTQRVYAIASDVNADGYTDAGELDLLKEQSETQRRQAENMLVLIGSSNIGSSRKRSTLLEDKTIEAEMDRLRKNTALPAPSEVQEVQIENPVVTTDNNTHLNGAMGVDGDVEIVSE